jgi:membrane-bound lytic murein transglycosylase D
MKKAVQTLETEDIGTIIRTYDGDKYKFAARNFYPEFLAAREVFQNYKSYFGRLDLEKPPPYQEYRLPQAIQIKDLAEALKISPEDLRDLNPGLTRLALQSRRLLPKGFSLRLDPGLKIPDSLFAKKTLIISKTSPKALIVSQPPERSHIVTKNRTTTDIVNPTPAQSSKPPKNSLIINPAPGQSSKPQKNPLIVVNPEAPRECYQVKSGDTLIKIAKKFGLSVKRLVALNQLGPNHVIKVGQTLRLSGKKCSP